MIDLISIVFRDEVPLLRTQAESINQYINSDEINTITIVVNDTDDVVELIDPSWYNHTKVNIIPYSKWGHTCRVNGWEHQQLCKLLAASEANADWSLVLDAKTWFVKPFLVSELFDNNRGRVGRGKIATVFESSSKFVEQLYNIELPETLGPNGVPFLFHTKTTQELIQSQTDFADFFQTNVRYPNLVTEFHLYSGFVISKYGSLDALYTQEQSYFPINIAHYEWEHFDQLLESMYDAKVNTVSIHRKVYANLTDTQLKQWADFLQSKMLNISIQEI